MRIEVVLVLARLRGGGRPELHGVGHQLDAGRGVDEHRKHPGGHEEDEHGL